MAENGQPPVWERPRHPATVRDFRDLDLMLKLQAEGGEAEVAEITESMGFGEQDRRGVGIRLSWMKRFGMLAYDEKRKLWMLSKGGERVVQARIRAATQRQLEELPDEAMIEVMASVTSRWRTGDPMVADLLRREFQFGTQRR